MSSSAVLPELPEDAWWPRRILVGFQTLMVLEDEPGNPQAGALINRAFDYEVDEAHIQRMRDTPEGARLLSTRPSLEREDLDLEALASLPFATQLSCARRGSEAAPPGLSWSSSLKRTGTRRWTECAGCCWARARHSSIVSGGGMREDELMSRSGVFAASACLSLSLLLGSGCGRPAIVESDGDGSETGSETGEGGDGDGEAEGGTSEGDTDPATGDGDGDPSGDGDGDPSGDGDGDPSGDGDGDPSGDGDGDPSGDGDGDEDPCPPGSEGCPCDIGSMCDGDLVCEDGVCLPPPSCEPLDVDPHGDEATAIGLDGLGCGDSLDLGVAATIEGPQVDWYRFAGNEQGFCGEEPSASVSADGPLQVCVFIECQSGGDASRTCGGGSADASSPQGRPGCCGENSALITDYGCEGWGSDDLDVYVAVGSEDEVCLDYGLVVGF